VKLALVFAVPILAFASVAMADEVIQTHDGQTPAAAQPDAAPASVETDQRQANGEWARRVLAGQPTDGADADDRARDGRARDGKGCERNPDRAPHGEVWAGIGSRGYRNAGGVVTEPIGDCGQATIAIDSTQFDGLNRGRRR
jgi:hypothetical protein